MICFENEVDCDWISRNLHCFVECTKFSDLLYVLKLDTDSLESWKWYENVVWFFEEQLTNNLSFFREERVCFYGLNQTSPKFQELKLKKGTIISTKF